MDDADAKADTRIRLIEAGLHLFGRDGYEGTSTRALAARAGTNIASIKYHFGGKADLRAACAMAVTQRVSDVLDGAGVLNAPDSATAAQAQIEQLVKGLVALIVGAPDAQDMVAFMLREITGPSVIAENVYARMVEPRHTALCRLWATATGRDPEDEAVKLAVFAMIGQVVYFRISSHFVVRRMAWDVVGPSETQKISDTVIAFLRDAIERQRI